MIRPLSWYAAAHLVQDIAISQYSHIAADGHHKSSPPSGRAVSCHGAKIRRDTRFTTIESRRGWKSKLFCCAAPGDPDLCSTWRPGPSPLKQALVKPSLFNSYVLPPSLPCLGSSPRSPSPEIACKRFLSSKYMFAKKKNCSIVFPL